MVAGHKAPYMHKDGSDCYTKNCSLDHAVTKDQQNKAIHSDFERKMALLEEELAQRLAENDAAHEADVEAYHQKRASTNPSDVLSNITLRTRKALDSLCGDYPAPCNCDDPNTHDGHIYQYSGITPDLLGETEIVSTDDPAVQEGEVFDEVIYDGRLYSRRREGVFPGSPYGMRIQANRPLTEEEAYNLAGLVGYTYRATIAGESLSSPDIDSPYSFAVGADTTKSQRDDLGMGFEDFENSLNNTIAEGSPLRKTDRSGPGTKGTRLVQGMGADLKVEVYWDDSFRPKSN
jgi:hypothetical protein